MSGPAWEQDDQSGLLAERLGMDVLAFVAQVGAGWTPRHLHADDLDPDQPEWFVSGEPVQLLLALGEEPGQVLLAEPRGTWRGHHLVYGPGRTVHAALDPRGERPHPDVAPLLRRRRATFRFCRYCRSSVATEWRDAADVCMSCAERWLGVVH